LNYVTDTHSLVWYFTDDHRLSKKALKSFEDTVKEGQIIVPTVVLAEILFMRPLKNTVSAYMSSFRRKPESSAFNNFLDSGSSPE